MTEPTPAIGDSTDSTDSGDVPPPGVDPDYTGEEPPEETPPVPDPVPAPAPITWEPQTWYAITFACVTPGCSEQNIIKSAPMFYSNNGDPKYIRVVCAADGCCGKDCTILTATKLNPQPVEE